MRKIVLMTLAVGLGCLEAKADQTVPQVESMPIQATNWSGNLVFSKFDSTLGQLTSLTFTLTSHLQGSAAFENTSPADATVNLILKADITLGTTPATAIVTTSLSSATSDKTGAFDGAIDFGGTSGKTYGNLTADKSVTVSLTDTASINLFTGFGSITLPISATASSAGSGLGNILTKFASSASATASLVYNYTPGSGLPNGQGGVPEPSSIVLAACGGIAMVVLGRKRRTRSA